MKAQRLRFRFRLTEASDLRPRDIVEAWAEAARAACLDLSHSEGKRPSPQISLAAPLPTGVTSDGELLDLYLKTPVEPLVAIQRLAETLPPGIEPLAVTEVGTGAASVQSLLRLAEYEVDVGAEGLDDAEVRAKIECLLLKDSIPAEYRRETKSKAYDLRPLILHISLAGRTGDDQVRLSMTLRAEQENSARADQVVQALGLPKPARVHRTRMRLVDVPPVIVAYRRGGERED